MEHDINKMFSKNQLVTRLTKVKKKETKSKEQTKKNNKQTKRDISHVFERSYCTITVHDDLQYNELKI